MSPFASGLYRIAGEDMLCFGRGPTSEAHLTPDGWLNLSGEPVADLNLGLIWPGPAAEERLREFAARIDRRGLPCLVLLPDRLSDQLAAVARECALVHVGEVPLMVFEPGSGLPTHSAYSVEIVATEAGRVEAMALAARAFSLPTDAMDRFCGQSFLETPGVDLFLARKDGETISTVTTTRRGSTVGIWTMATPPERQRQGAGYAVLAAAVNHHRERGAKVFYLFASEAGQPLYKKVGFETGANLAAWERDHSTQVPAWE